MSKRRLVIVGNGMAGARFVEEARQPRRPQPVRHRDLRRRTVRGLQPDPALERARGPSPAVRYRHQSAGLVCRARRRAARRRQQSRQSTPHGRPSARPMAASSRTTSSSSPPAAGRFCRPSTASSTRSSSGAWMIAPGSWNGPGTAGEHRDWRRAARPRSRAWIVQSRRRRPRRPSRTAPDGGAARRAGRRGAAAAVHRRSASACRRRGRRRRFAPTAIE